eukprot:GHVR01123913.1.p1 GENE.GHVR01123913.1~~GHVR01123913.1.p1  ORF type:complete len:607 (+),score=140.85 GHVR01123913.1:31-1821(+)
MNSNNILSNCSEELYVIILFNICEKLNIIQDKFKNISKENIFKIIIPCAGTHVINIYNNIQLKHINAPRKYILLEEYIKDFNCYNNNNIFKYVNNNNIYKYNNIRRYTSNIITSINNNNISSSSSNSIISNNNDSTTTTTTTTHPIISHNTPISHIDPILPHIVSAIGPIVSTRIGPIVSTREQYRSHLLKAAHSALIDGCKLNTRECKATVECSSTKKSLTPIGPQPSSYINDIECCEVYHYESSFTTSYNMTIPELFIGYECWGTLNKDRNNAILLCCGLSSSSHAKSSDQNPKPGWWEQFIGPGQTLDTDQYFIICPNHLGGCFGTSGPSSLNPITGTSYGLDFPLFTVQDQVRVHFLLLDHLCIDVLHAVVGSSLGGMQSLSAASIFPHRVRRLVSISACAESHPTAVAIRYAQRQVLMADPCFLNGRYYGCCFPWRGMQLARVIGTITYRSGPDFERRFGRKRVGAVTAEGALGADFALEQYLEHQAIKFSRVYDPNTLVLISKAMDLFSIADGHASLEDGVRSVQMPSLILGVTTDALFPSCQQRHIASLLRKVGNTSVVYYELDSDFGHDTFLIDVNTVGAAVKGHLNT